MGGPQPGWLRSSPQGWVHGVREKSSLISSLDLWLSFDRNQVYQDNKRGFLLLIQGREKLKKELNPTVYSTEHGRICPDCSRPLKSCICSKNKGVKPGDGTVRIGRETKGRGGKAVTTISGLPLDQPGLTALAKELKRRCGSGGTVKGNTIEIQGDHRDKLFEELARDGWRVKRCGG